MDVLNSPEFSAYIKKVIGLHHIPGLAIATVHGDTLASTSCGVARVDPPAELLASETLVSVGSASKSLTAAAVALMVSDNDKYPQVQYDATMASLLPEDFVMPGDDHMDVTVEDILSHRTGMAPHEFSLFGSKGKQPDDARSITRNLRNLPTVAPNREEHLYNNMMYTVATLLIENLSGMSFSEFLQKHFFQPLGMNSTFLQPGSARAKGFGDRMAFGYRRDKETDNYLELPYVDRPESQGAGQIVTTVSDYVKWVKAMINREGPVTEEIYQALTKKQIQEDPSEDPDSEHIVFYCSGLQVQNYCGHALFSHDGRDNGSQCDHFFIPELKFGCVIYGNADHANAAISRIKYQLVDQMIKLQDKNSLADSKLTFECESELEMDDDDEEDDLELEQELQQELCPGINERQPQTMPLDCYTGQYWNPGYRGITIEIKDDALFVNCEDRSMPFSLTFKHVCQQTKYLAFLAEVNDPKQLPVKAEFVLEGQKAIKLGIELEEKLDQYIWFERI